MDNEKLLKPRELKANLNISEQTYRQMLDDGMPCIRLSVVGNRRFDYQEVLEFLKKRGNDGC